MTQLHNLFQNFYFEENPDGSEKDNFADARSDKSQHNFSLIIKMELICHCFILVNFQE